MKPIKNIAILIIFLSVSSTYGQTENLMVVVNKIVDINEVQYEHIGRGTTEGENYKNFQKLREIASTEELVHLTDHNNATVACYASWALADKTYPELVKIFEKFIADNKQVTTISGCFKSQDKISSELYHRFWNHIDDDQKSTNKILIQLDSIILFSKNPYWLLLTRALENRVYQEPYKSQIAILAFEDGKRDAIFYLSNWHKAEYVDELKIALTNYLNKTDFKETGTVDYYRTLEHLFSFNDPNIRKVIIAKLKSDRHWEKQKERFKYLLSDNNIFNIDNE